MPTLQQGPVTKSRLALEWLVAAVVGAVLLLLSNLLMPPAAAPFPGHGERFAEMAQAPFAFAGEFPQRVLWPLLAWLFSYVGVGVVLFSNLCNGALLAVVYWFARRRTGAQGLAFLVTAAVAVSGAVLVYQPMMCFSDTLNLLLMVLLIHFANRGRVFWSLVLLSAFSHELVFFFSAWLIYLRLCNGGRLWPEVGCWAVCLLLYGGFRVALKVTGNTGEYDSAYYFENAFWVPWGLPAIWALWGFVVVVEFGPLLVALFFASRRGLLMQPSAMGGRWWPWLFFSSLLALMLLAYDVMRFAPLVFAPVLLALVALARSYRGPLILSALILSQVGCYAWLHPNAAEQGGRQFTEVSGYILANIGLLVSRQPGDAMALVWGLLTQFWGYALCAALALVGFIVSGRWLARWGYDGAARMNSSDPSE